MVMSCSLEVCLKARLLSFFAERERPIHLSKFPVLPTVPKRFRNECETSELSRLGSIGLIRDCTAEAPAATCTKLTCRRRSLFRALQGPITPSARTGHDRHNAPRAHH